MLWAGPVPYRRNGCWSLRWVLLGPDIGGLWRKRGLRLVATNLLFSAGAGLEVRGAAEGLLMAIAGRRDVADELTGLGRARLTGRISRSWPPSAWRTVPRRNHHAQNCAIVPSTTGG